MKRLALSLVAIAVAFAGTPMETAGFAKMEADWRTHREAKLRAADGWLSVAGLFWLHDGAMAMGSDPQSDVVLPASAPRRAGTLRMQAGAVTFESVAGVHATINGKPATKSVLKPDTDDP